MGKDEELKSYTPPNQQHPLKDYLQQKLKELEQKNPAYSRQLIGELLHWGSCVPVPGTLGDLMLEQIEFRAEKNDVTPKEFIDHLFRLQDADTWMCAFQIG